MMSMDVLPAPMTVDVASRFLGVRKAVLRDHIETGDIEYSNGFISGESLAAIQKQQAELINLRDFLEQYNSSLFSSSKAYDRAKYVEFLENHHYFGIEVIPLEKVLFSVFGRGEFFIKRTDMDFLDFKSRSFFDDFGVSEREKVERILNDPKANADTRHFMREYLKYLEDEKNIYTPSLTAFVRIIFEIPDICSASDADVINAIEAAETVTAKELLVGFLTFVSALEKVDYNCIKMKNNEKEAVHAYSYEEFTGLARVLFNADYEKAHHLTEKALEKSFNAEMWLFLACHYVCGWRASDICTNWVYPNLKGTDNPFGLCTDTLKEDILSGIIPDTVYETVALYVIRRIEMAFNMPKKTGMGKLRSEILPELRPFFGKLTLIAEYHHLTDGEGYMKPCRIFYYRNWVRCRDFFGEEILEVTGKTPLSSRRLNKSYLQGMEQAARNNGNTSLVSHMIAAYARNHADADTTLVYLRDHGLTGETAGVVLFMMMQRGVFGADLYHALLAAYPESFQQLSAKEQSLLMEKIPLSAYDLEISGAAFAATEEMSRKFAQGDKQVPLETLKAMLLVAQGKGKAKEEGIYCKQKAFGFSCDHPVYKSCIANLCPNHIFTSEGVPSLLRVIRDYSEKYRSTGNPKYAAVLKKCIIPAFQEILSEVIRGMNGKERAAVRKLIEEGLDG